MRPVFNVSGRFPQKPRATGMLLGGAGGYLTPDFAFDFLQSPNPIIGGGTTTTTIDADGTFTNASGLITPKTADVWPLDYDPVTLQPLGGPVWEARTNLVLQSQDLGTTWTRESIIAGQTNVAISPDGTQNADAIIPAVASATHAVSQAITVVSATTYAPSVFVKAAGYNFAVLQFIGGTNTAVQINLTTGATSTITGSPANVNAEPLPNGWWRLSFAATTSGTSGTFRVYAVETTGTLTFTGNGTSGIYAWGAQLEAGSFPPPYIPTAGTAVTRAADACSIAFNPGAQGTVVVEWIPGANAGADQFIALLGTANDGIRIQQFGLDAYVVVITGGVTQASMLLGSVTLGAISRIAVAFAANDFAASLNGGTVVTDVSGTVPTMSALYLGASDTVASCLNGWLRKLYYYRRAQYGDALTRLSRIF